MKKFLGILILILTLQTPSQADDIQDFQIEGMSIGDSALDYFSEEEIKNNYVKLIKTLDLLARPRGFEPLTLGLENRCSIKNPLKTNIRHKIIQQNDQKLYRVVTWL